MTAPLCVFVALEECIVVEVDKNKKLEDELERERSEHSELCTAVVLALRQLGLEQAGGSARSPRTLGSCVTR